MPYDELLPRSRTPAVSAPFSSTAVDAELPVLILRAKALIEQSHALAVASCCLLSDVLNRGTQVRTLTLLSRECMRRKPQYHIPYVTDSNRPNAGGSQYQGGHVLQPTPGVHRNLAVYDFAGPSTVCGAPGRLQHAVPRSLSASTANTCCRASSHSIHGHRSAAWACAVRPSSSTHTSILPVFFVGDYRILCRLCTNDYGKLAEVATRDEEALKALSVAPLSTASPTSSEGVQGRHQQRAGSSAPPRADSRPAVCRSSICAWGGTPDGGQVDGGVARSLRVRRH